MPYKDINKRRQVSNISTKKRYWENIEESREKERNRIRVRDERYYQQQKEYMREYRKRPEIKERLLINRYANRYFREKLLKKYKHTCPGCGSKDNLEIHHLSYDTEKNYGVKHSINQCMILCRTCHGKIHRK